MHASHEIKIQNNQFNVIIVGVGGQGTLLSSNFIAQLGMELQMDVKRAEVHGMSQRGGSVVSHIRWGKKVFSPIIISGSADVVLALEELETARFSHMAKKDGVIIANQYCIPPITVSSGIVSYPEKSQLNIILNESTPNLFWIDGSEIAKKLGNIRVANVVLIGALSGLMDIDLVYWHTAMEKIMPQKLIEINEKAFFAGREAVSTEVS